jgi:peroxiredoxin (alkyl hydroperoxide reductase subunit C)
MQTETSVSKPTIQLGAQAPDFECNTTFGPIKFSDWQKGRWVILFSHPADFTPVCSTEFAEFAKRSDEFEKKNVALLGNSVDSVYSHLAWVDSIEKHFNVKVKFPVIADLDQKISQLYNMIHEPMAVTAAVRCVFFIDPKRVVRAMIYYPLNLGRNFDEIMRVIDGLQAADKHGLACPANWTPGQEMIVPAPTTMAAMAERRGDKNLNVKDWYLSTKKV